MTSARRSPSTRPPTELRRLLVLCLAVTGVLAGSLSATALGAGDRPARQRARAVFRSQLGPRP